MKYSIKDYSLTAADKGWGLGWPVCTARTQTAVVTAPISGVSVVVHRRIARLAYLGIAETERRGYLLRPGQCWGGNCRAIAGTVVSSNHAWWLALDLNSLANPYVLKRGGQPVTDMPPWLPLLWNSLGFAWGGDYSGTRADAMHLEFMGSPEDADKMTALAEVRLRDAHYRDGAWVITDMEDDVALTPKQAQNIDDIGEIKRMVGVLAGWPGAATDFEVAAQRGPADANETRRMLGVLLGWQGPATEGEAAALAALRAGGTVTVDVDEQAIVNGLAPMLLARLGALSDEDVARLASAAADESDRRTRARLAIATPTS